MSLSSDLISQFVKVTNDNNPTAKKESTVYGTTVEYNGAIYVKLDGSELLTPISTTTDNKPGDRVTVMIKNHTAMITGNISSPAARTDDVQHIGNKITEAEILIADKVSTKELEVEQGRIDKLMADTVVIKKSLTVTEADISNLKADNVTITETLTTNKADIANLKANKLDATIADLTYATIEELTATNANIHNLEATYGEFEDLTTNRLTATEADISSLKTNKLDANTAEITYATIDSLNATTANINKLSSNIADIDTLIFGTASGDVIQTSFANAVIAQLGNAQIKSAMIDTVSADKITAGDIITNNVRVRSEDGNMLISDETIQISDDTRVRVQIGKDASGDYSINIWDADGKLMFSEGGITDNAIKGAIIRNDMVSDTANISAHKLNINSLFEEINDSEKTIKSSRVYLDDKEQTLDIAFETMTTDLEEIQNGVTSQGTQLTAIQGQIASKVWQTDIDTAVSEIESVTETLSTQYSEMKQDLTGFKTTVSNTYATKTALNNLSIGGRNYFVRNNVNNLAWGSADDEHPNGKILENPYCRGYSFKVNEGEKWTIFRTDATNNRWGVYWVAEKPAFNVGTLSCAFRADDQAANVVNYLTVPAGATWGFIYLSNNIGEGEVPNIMLEKATRASDWTPAPEDIENEVDSLETRVHNAETSISQNTEAIELKASRTEVITAKNEAIQTAGNDAKTKADKALADANANTANELKKYSTTAEMNAAISTSADSIRSTVSSTYATKKEVDDIEVGGCNYFTMSKVVDLGCTGLSSGEQSLISTGACIGFYVPTKPGDIWSISRDSTSNNRFDYCFTVDEPTNGTLIYGWNSGYRESLEMVGIVIPDGYNYLFLYLSNQDDNMPKIKLEKGNKVTDWTPSPDDMATGDDLTIMQSSAALVEERVTTTESLIEQLSTSISMLVTDGNGESLMTQTENGWTFSTGAIQNMVNTTSEQLNTLTNEVGDIDSTVDVLQQTVNELGVLSDYVKITTYEDEPCIELGETDSDFKLLITNTRILFMEGTDVPAYINNQSLFIKNAIIEEELQQGEFVWKARSNGNLGLIWKEANS